MKWFVLSLAVVVIVFNLTADAASTPIIFNHSISSNPGDVIGVQGTMFGSNPQVFLSQSTNKTRQLRTVNKGNNFTAVEIPKDEPFGLYKIQVVNGTSYSNVVYLNQAHGMSFDTPEIAPNGKFRIFGRNLLLSGATPSVRFVNPATKVSTNAAVTTTGSDAYVLNVTAPSGITPGVHYDVYVSNGYGGATGETKVDETLLGRKGGVDKWDLGVGWAGDYDFYNNVYNVKTDSRLSIRAVGNGVNDDQAAIQNAINVASKAGGGVVYLPRGTYKLALKTNTIGIKMAPRVVLQGEGRDITIIKYGYGQYPSVGGYVVEWPNGTLVAGITDLTLDNVNEQGKWYNSMHSYGKVSELFMQRIKFNMSSADSIYMGNMEKLVIENSVFNHSFNVQDHGPWVLSGNKYFVIRGNSVTHATGGYAVNSVSNGVIENNRFTRDGSFRAKTNFEVRSLSLNFATNIAVLNNTFDVINGPVSVLNDGETILTEGGGAIRPDESIGTVSNAANLTLQDSSKDWNSLSFTNKAIVAIVSGNGTGQWRAITGVADKSTLKIDRPWDVVPEKGAHYTTFDWSAANWIVKGNKLTDNPRGIWLYSASSRDIAIVGNTLVNNGGIYLRTDQITGATVPRHTVMFNVQILNNNVSNTNGLGGAYIGDVSAQVSKETTFGVGLLGLEIRGNTLTAYTSNTNSNNGLDREEGYYNLVSYQYGGTAPFNDTNQPVLVGTIFQGNKANNCDESYQLSTGAYWTTIWNSTAVNTQRFLRDHLSGPGASRASTETVVGPSS